jgi:hypothetical protein
MASYITINGHSFPSPKRGAKPTISTFVNSGRNASGVVVGQKIGRDQYKLDSMVWPWLPAETWGEILTVLDNFFVNVTFTDPVTGKKRTIKMYPGDRTAEPYYLDKDGNPTFYYNCKVNFTDCGEV